MSTYETKIAHLSSDISLALKSNRYLKVLKHVVIRANAKELFESKNLKTEKSLQSIIIEDNTKKVIKS